MVVMVVKGGGGAYLNQQEDEVYAKCKQVSLCCLSSAMNTLGAVVIIYSPSSAINQGLPLTVDRLVHTMCSVCVCACVYVCVCVCVCVGVSLCVFVCCFSLADTDSFAYISMQ